MSDETLRSVELTRVGKAAFRATNVRGSTISIGEGDTEDFTPIELLLVAIAGCSAMDVDHLIGKRVDPERFDLHARGDKVRDEGGNHLTNLHVTFDVGFPAGDDGDTALARLPRAIQQSNDRLCTVSQTVQLGTPIAMDIAE